MMSGHPSDGGSDAPCGCQGPRRSSSIAEVEQELEEPAGVKVQITNPQRLVRKVIVHYRGVTPAGLAAWIVFNRVPDSKMWALVVVIAILTLGDIFIARRSE